MAKFLTLMNPHRRRRSRRRLYGAALAAHRRKSGGSRRRTRRNPAATRRRITRRRRSAPPRMTPAMRAKISRAVKASFRRRRSGGGAIRRAGRRVMALARRPVYSSPVRRSRSRRSGSVGGFGGSGGLVSSFKRSFTKPLLMKASGAVAASLGTGLVIQKYGAKLPGINNKWGRVAYSVGIPIAGAYVVGKYLKQRDIAEGMIIGGLVMGINALIQQARAGAATATVADYPELEDMAVAGELGYSYYPSRPGMVGSDMSGAFPTSAW